MRTLVLGHAPESSLDELYVYAGPWCLAQCPEKLDNNWLFPPEPFAAPEHLETAVAQARRLTAVAAEDLRARLNAHHKTALSAAFWDTALAPWLCSAVEVLVDRIWRLEGLKTLWGDTPLRVPLPGDDIPPFAATSQFMLHGALNPFWNHWLFAKLLQGRMPEAWKPQGFYSEPFTLPLPEAEPLPRRLARRILNALPFPRVKGFTTGQSLRLSLTLLRSKDTADRTMPLSALAENADAPPLPMPDAELCALLHRILPQSFLAPLPAPGMRLSRTRVAPVGSADDDDLRFSLAWHRERKGKLIYIQHGGEYGYVRSQLAYTAVEYRHHAFISWGWTEHGRLPNGENHVIPLPHPHLSRSPHRETDPRLLFVGTEMALIPYNLKSTRRTTQQLEYRALKGRFLEALPPALLASTHYRPYFDLPCTLPDAPWVLSRYPAVTRCTGPLEPHVFSCRLLVLDHLGTTLAQAMAANVPLLIFRNPDHQPVSPETHPLLTQLAEAGILYSRPEDAAAHCAAIWDNVAGWWSRPTVQAARKAFTTLHALQEVAPYTHWERALCEQG